MHSEYRRRELSVENVSHFNQGAKDKSSGQGTCRDIRMAHQKRTLQMKVAMGNFPKGMPHHQYVGRL